MFRMSRYLKLSMKIRIFSCAGIFLVLSGWLKAQSLSFSRVILISSAEDTVPAGRVWKIESILTSYSYQYPGGTSCVTSDNAYQIFLNGNSKYLQDGAPGTGTSTVYMGNHSFPFWIPEGSRLRTNCASTHLSVLEFRVVP